MARNYEWFVWPKNSHTNNVIVGMLRDGEQGSEENTLSNVLCEDGKLRNLWAVSQVEARFCWNSKDDKHLKLEIFNRRGSRGKIRNVTFLFSRQKA